MPLACIPSAIPNRPRYNELRQKLRAAITEKSAQTWELDDTRLTLTETAEWIEMERLCRPFLKFNLEINDEPGHRLTMTGLEETAAFLKHEFEI